MTRIWSDPGLWVLLHLRRPGDRRGDTRGLCAVCGADSRFVRNSWILPAELAREWPPEFVDRESQLCEECGSNRRVRGIAEVLISLYGEGARSIAELVREERFRGLDIAEINSIGRMHPFLAEHPRLVYSEYPDEDLMALSYDDARFDLVLTSDTLEHVPDPRVALRETRRILRNGGRHVFTVPHDPRRSVTRSREGLPAQHHGRGGGPFTLVTRQADMLAHTDFGADVPELLRKAGFEAETYFDGVESVFCGVVRDGRP
jgi:SAM-dependent methyltransferase